MTVDLRHGDNLKVLPTLADCSVDSIVTDPPYGLAFMGRAWDQSVPVDIWSECLRVLKPGGHLLAFGGTRTWHRLAVAIEDAGFEIRDSIMSAGLAWMQGSGFPKSLNVSRDQRFCQCPSVGPAVPYSHVTESSGVDLSGVRSAVLPVADEAAGESPPGVLAAVSGDAGRGPACEHRGQGAGRMDAGERGVISSEDVRPAEPRLEGWGDVQAAEGQLHRPSVRALPSGPDGDGPVGRVRDGAPASDGSVDRSPADAHRVRESRGSQPAEQSAVEPGSLADERGSQARRVRPVCGGCGKPRLASGLGTALKPAWEPIVVARKPLGTTVAANVLEHGTGALNVDATRVGTDTITQHGRGDSQSGSLSGRNYAEPAGRAWTGRWPANVVLTHGEDCQQVGTRTVRTGTAVKRNRGGEQNAHGIYGSHVREPDDDQTFGSADGREEIPAFACVPGCPVAELDAQSGTLKSGDVAGSKRNTVGGNEVTHGAMTGVIGQSYADQGGASRFFPTFRYQAKAPAAERPKVDGQGWPTVKPLALMRWLVRLVTPPGGLVLDPFAGTGATLQAAELEGFDSLGVELDPHAYALACQRLGIETAA